MNTLKLKNTALTSSLLCVAATSAFAQGQPDPASIAARSFGFLEVPGQTVVSAPSYEATFDDSGMRYEPVLGASAPDSAFVLRAASVSRAEGAAIVLRGGAPKQTADRVTIDRGHGIQECFDVSIDGVELSYVLTRPVRGSGDLIVRTRVDTELEAPCGRFEQGLKFTNEAGRGVAIGGVTGISADGATARGELRWNGEFLDLALPAEFVARASYPLVIDPLVGTEQVGDTGQFDSVRADVAYDVSTGHYLVAFVRQMSLNVSRIRAQRVNANGTLDGAVISISGNNLSVATNPSVANNNQLNRFAVVWQEADSAIGPFDIRLAAVEAASGGAVGAPFAVTTAGPNEIDPVVSGERTPDVTSSRDEVLVAWHTQGAGIQARQIDIDPLTSSFVGFVIDVDSDASARHPAISKSGGDAGRHVIAWEAAQSSVRARAYSRELTAFAPAITITTNGFCPAVDGDGNHFLVAFERSESGFEGTAPRNVGCRMTRFSSNSLVAVGNIDLFASTPNDDECAPTVAFLGPKFAVAWSEADPALFDYRGRVRSFAPNRCTICSELESFGIGSVRVSDIAMASQWSGGSASTQALIAWGEYDLGAPFESEIKLHRYQAMLGSGGVVQNAAAGCGGGGVAGISGNFQMANTVAVELNGADPLALSGALHIGSVGTPLVPCGPCSILTPFVAIPVMIQFGSTSVDLSIGCSTDLVGQSIRFQFANAVTSTAPCLNLPVGLSNVLEAQFAY